MNQTDMHTWLAREDGAARGLTRRRTIFGWGASAAVLVAAACGEVEVRYVQGPPGPPGPQGPQGEKGAAGPPGAKGAAGKAGKAVIVEKKVEVPVPAKPAKAKQLVKIELWEQRGGEMGNRFKRAALAFNQQQDRVTLAVVPVPPGKGGRTAKVVAAASGGAGPDVMLDNAVAVSSYLDTPLLLDLDTALKANKFWAERKQHVYPRILAGHFWRGKLATLPAIGSAIAVFYNKELLKQAGLPEPAPTWTWDDFLSISKKVKQATGKWGGSFPPQSVHAGLYWHNWAACNKIVLVDAAQGKENLSKPAALEVTTYLENLVRKQEVMVLAAIRRDGTPPPKGTPFASGNAAFETQLPATLKTWQKRGLNVGVAPMPIKKQSSSYGIPDHLPIFKTGKPERQEASIEFGLWVAKPETQVSYALLTNRSPSYADATKLPAFREYVKGDPRIAVFEQAMAQSEPPVFVPKTGRFFGIAGKQIAAVLQGKSSVRAAHELAARELQVELDKTYKKS